jgi:hypothetical protein
MSMNALTRDRDSDSIIIVGRVRDQPINILIDIGAGQSYIQYQLLLYMEWKGEISRPAKVNISGKFILDSPGGNFKAC